MKPKPIVARACTFSRALCRLRVITSTFDWFTGLSPCFLIGQSNYFGSGFTTWLKLALLLKIGRKWLLRIGCQTGRASNGPFPRSCLPPLQSECTCKVFVMVITSTLHMNENFTLRLALKRRQIWTRKWLIVCVSGHKWGSSWALNIKPIEIRFVLIWQHL